VGDQEHTDRIFWRVVAHAATRPLNVAVLVLLVLASVLVAPWIAVAIVPVYGLLVAATVNDPETAQRLAAGRQQRQLTSGRRLDGVTGDLRMRVATALGEERRIHEALAELPPVDDGLGTQVRALADDLVEVARRASVVDLYLASVDVDDVRRRHDAASGRARDALGEQLAIIEVLQVRRAELDEEICHVEAALPAIRARLVQARMSATRPTGLADDVTALRTRMTILADSLAEAYGVNDPTTPKGA
jgi:hypothetical protein